MRPKLEKTLCGLLVFGISSVVFYCISYVVVYITTWISNILKPIPEGVDMYREATRLAFEAFPSKNAVAVISVIIAVSCGLLVALLWRPYNKQAVSPRENRTHTKLVTFYSDEEQEDETKAEQKKHISSPDWYDHSLEDHDNEDGWCTECEEYEEDLE